MSVENNIFILRDKLPSSEAWAQAIRANGFDMATHEGFLVCKYQGKHAGFEYWTEAVDIGEFLEDDMLTEQEAEQLADRHFMITLTTYADFREYMTSMIGAAVLCALTDGMLAEGGAPPFINAGEAIAWAKQCEPAIQKKL